MRHYLIQCRQNAKLTQTDAAALLNISQNYLSTIERGERQKALNIASLSAFSKVYGVDLNYLIEMELKHIIGG